MSLCGDTKSGDTWGCWTARSRSSPAPGRGWPRRRWRSSCAKAPRSSRPTSAARRRTPRPRWATACCPSTATSTNEADVEAAMRAAVEEFGQLDAVLQRRRHRRRGDARRRHHRALRQADGRRPARRVPRHQARRSGSMLEAGNGGAIVNWSSLGGLNASPFTSVYSAAKAGVIALHQGGGGRVRRPRASAPTASAPASSTPR